MFSAGRETVYMVGEQVGWSLVTGQPTCDFLTESDIKC